jgi:hypothetical protein
MNNLNNELGILAAALATISHIFYIVAIIRGQTKPSRITWFIWAALGIIIASTYYYSGARSTLWVPIGEAFWYTAIAILSVKYGVGGWQKIDKIALVGVAISGVLWYISGSPIWGLVAALGVDLMAAAPTIYKSYKNPETEDKSAWILTSLGSLINVIAINSWVFSIIVYPLYMLIMNGSITALLFKRKKSTI